MEDYKKKYEQALAKAREIHRNEDEKRFDMEWLFPELKESEDERTRKGILELVRQSSEVLDKQNQNNMIAWLEKQGECKDTFPIPTRETILSIWELGNDWKDITHGSISTKYGTQLEYIQKHWQESEYYLEKQSSSSAKWQKNSADNKPTSNHSVLMKTIQGIAEGEWQCEHWFQYRWSWILKDSDVLAWMELSDLDEQNEQKPFDYEHATITQKDFAPKEEPKFKVGDWVVYECGEDSATLQIKNIVDRTYEFTDDSTLNVVDEDTLRLWSIKDAKDGDVLYSLDSYQPFIYKERKPFEQATAHCGINKYGKFFVWNTKDCIITLDKYIPATKEQRELLFKKMKEAGYKWDADKKELDKVEKKQEWSEEDKKMYRMCIDAVEYYHTPEDESVVRDWLKSLKDRVKGKEE